MTKNLFSEVDINALRITNHLISAPRRITEHQEIMMHGLDLGKHSMLEWVPCMSIHYFTGDR
jgi:streptomycin 6-kinase